MNSELGEERLLRKKYENALKEILSITKDTPELEAFTNIVEQALE